MRSRYLGIGLNRMIEVSGRTTKQCPCGCGKEVPQIEGTVRDGDSFADFAAYLMSEDGMSNLWLMFHTGPWPGCERDCAIFVHSQTRPEGLHAYILNAEASPFGPEEIDNLHLMTREQVLAQEGGKEWLFTAHDEVVCGIHEISVFLEPGIEHGDDAVARH